MSPLLNHVLIIIAIATAGMLLMLMRPKNIFEAWWWGSGAGMATARIKGGDGFLSEEPPVMSQPNLPSPTLYLKRNSQGDRLR